MLAAAVLAASAVHAQSSAAASSAGLVPGRTPPASASPVAAASATGPRWATVPRVVDRLQTRHLGLVVNTADPYSVAIGAYYADKRGLKPEQVLRVELPLRPELRAEEFEALRGSIDAHFGNDTHALALAWVQPYAVGCNSLTGALALGYDGALCRQTCAPSRPSPVANSASSRPYGDHGMRLSMLLAAPDVDSARRMIDRGVAADHTLGLRGALPANVYLLTTDDASRNVRARLYPPPGRLRRLGLEVHVEPADAVGELTRVLLLQVGSSRVPQLAQVQWLPGGLGDHLTSFGGQLARDSGQTRALEWIASGATATHGSVSEPCNHLQKFPHPQWLLLHYAQGATAIEAYWKSVLWPQQALFIGEPLAAPFARP